MAIHQTRGVTPQWWTPKSEQEEQAAYESRGESYEPVQFFVKPLTNPQLNQVMVDVDMDRAWPCGPQAVVSCLKWAVTDWTGVYGEDGSPLDYSARAASEVLPSALQQEIATHVVSISMVTDEDQKKS